MTTALATLADETAHRLAPHLAGNDFLRWCDQVNGLAPLGNAALIDLAAATIRSIYRFGVPVSLKLGETCLHIGELADASAARRMLRVAMGGVMAAPTASTYAEFLDMLVIVARQMPHVLPPLLDNQIEILSRLDAAKLKHWIGAGLSIATWDSENAIGYFRLQTEEARRILTQLASDIQFDDVRVDMTAYLQALWELRPVIATYPADQLPSHAVRTSFHGHLLRLPDAFPGFVGEAGKSQFRAALAHIAAHLTYGAGPQPAGRLKPLQIAIVSMIEDARVEALACSKFPGLNRLWAGQHRATPSAGVTPDKLIGRLARALADAGYADDNPWVEKGRDLFFAGRSRWDDPSFSREIGGLLGNDLGQMRVPFNARSYVVQPGYRDDNAGLWDIPPDAEAPQTTAEAIVASGPSSKPAAAVQARPDGRLIGRYSEWDYASGTHRRGWTTVFSLDPVPATDATARELGSGVERIVGRIERLIRAERVGRSRVVRGQLQGETLDLDACIRRRVEKLSGIEPEARVFQSRAVQGRQLSVLVLLDASQSTRGRIGDTTRTIISVERQAVAALGGAMHRVGDPFSVVGFCSDGRNDVRMLEVKGFAQAFDHDCLRRLGGLRGGLSTRLGAALRHSGDRLARQRVERKLVLVVTDGEPSDVDAPDERYLVEDARHAVQELKQRGVDVFAVALGTTADASMQRMFGRRGFRRVENIEQLPLRLTQLYHHLSA